MARVKRGNKRTQKRKRVLKLAKGYYGTKSRAYRIAMQAVDRSLAFAYRDRRQKKRSFRRLWIVRINAAARLNGISYNRLIEGLKKADCELNRKVLADLAVRDPEGFAAVADLAKEALGLHAQPEAEPVAESEPEPAAEAEPPAESEPEASAEADSAAESEPEPVAEPEPAGS